MSLYPKSISYSNLLDLSAAFDLVDPELLIEKLKIYGLEEDYLCWIQSYLADRHQSVWLDHTMSEFLHCEVGVPQGSNLGPLFFLIFFNDLPPTLKNEVDSYADRGDYSFTFSYCLPYLSFVIFNILP